VELLVVLVWTSDGVAGTQLVLRGYILARLLLHIVELRGVNMKQIGKVDSVCRAPSL